MILTLPRGHELHIVRPTHRDDGWFGGNWERDREQGYWMLSAGIYPLLTIILAWFDPARY